MSGERVARHTSVAIDVLASRADALLSPRVSEYLLPVPVVGELRYGALNSRKTEENLAKVRPWSRGAGYWMSPPLPRLCTRDCALR